MKKLFTILIAVLFVSANLFGQSKADKSYTNYAYKRAIKSYKKTLKKDPNNGEVLYKLATSYRLNNETLNAEYYYAKAVNHYEKPETKLYYAQMLLSNSKYAESEKWFYEYVKVAQNNYDKERAEQFARFCKKTEKIKNEKPTFDVEAVPFNSKALDFSPFIVTNGVMFCSNKKTTKKKLNQKDPWTDDNFVSLYQVTDSSGIYSESELFFSTIENKYHFGPSSLTKDQKKIYFTKSDYFKKKRQHDKNYNTRLSIFYAEKTDEGWDEFKSLPFNSEEYSNCHPAVSKDDEFIIFASDMPGGSGGMDLYIINKKDTSWTTPKNLGKNINTVGNEVFPFLDNNNNLYFSSNMHPGLGGLDVFKATKNTELLWENPENIGIPINSTRDDFGYVVTDDGKKGYFSSNRNGEQDDIYEFSSLNANYSTPAPEFPNDQYICGRVINKKYKNGLANAEVTLVNKCTGDYLSVLTDIDGNFTFPLDKNPCDYDIVGKKEKFEENALIISTIDTSFQDCYKVLIPLTFIETNIPDKISSSFTLTEGMILELQHVYFDLDKYKIRPDGFSELVELYNLLRKYPEMVGELSGHTDRRNTHKYNETLSLNRAKAAKTFLVNLGIKSERILVAGYGETQLKNHCADGVNCSDEEHQRNRRVEFKVLYLGKTLESDETRERGYFGER